MRRCKPSPFSAGSTFLFLASTFLRCITQAQNATHCVMDAHRWRLGFFVIGTLIPSICINAQSKNIKVIELRNYLLRPGQRDNFIDSFEVKIMDSLNGRRNYVLGQYRVRDAPDNFLWIRGFDDMASRKTALEGFYTSKYWEQLVNIPRKYVMNYTNVYLLKPLRIADRKMDSTVTIGTDWFGKPKGLAVVDFYVANEMRNLLLEFFTTTYDSVLHAAGVKDISYWMSETAPNDYPLPAFQDKNLLVTITFFNNQSQYIGTKSRIEEIMNEEQKFRMNRLVTTKTSWVLYPTEKPFKTSAQ